ncbi:MAG: hypothetical protein J1E59_09305 [Treponema sp.]|nr:hypothetical protein [Treponema sp.]
MMIVSDAAVSTAEKKEVAGRKHLYMSRAYGVTRGRMKGVATPRLSGNARNRARTYFLLGEKQ